MKRDKRDRVFSFLIRERASWTCERCQTYYPEGYRSGLECSHIFGRRNTRTRWHPDGAAAHCTGCHMYLTRNPTEFRDWAIEYLGEGRYEMLKERKNDTRLKYSQAEKESLYRHLKSELKRLESLRAEGKQGRLEFEAYD